MVRVRNALSKAKNRMLKAGRPIFRKVLPMAAALIVSCSQGTADENECDRFNSSTVVINESSSEIEQIADVDELRERSGFISEELAHAVRTTHELSTQGLPERFPTTFTINDEECFLDEDTGLSGTAHAITPRHDMQGDWGIYTHLSELTLDDFSLISHEIGHLQLSCGEVCAEVNAAEQMLMLFAAFSDRDGSDADIIKWAAQATSQLCGLEALHDALRHIYEEDFRLDPDPIVSMSMHPKWKYIRADVYILESLIRHNGSFLEIRDEIMSVRREELNAQAYESLERFVERYSESDLETALADIVAQIRMANYRELHRRFGAETAGAYFDSNSLVALRFADPRKIVMVDGLEGMNCMLVESAEIVSSEDCSGGCPGLGVVNAVSIEGARLHCFSVENADAPSFREFDVVADGIRYYGIMGRRITIGGVGYEAVIVFDSVSIQE